MKKRILTILALSGLAFAQASLPSSQPWVGILDPTRAIDWAQAGVLGGIPSGSWTQSGATITATGSDQTAQINSAITTCSASGNRYVLLAAGSFRINGNLIHKSNCVLRGAGANLTILDAHGTSGNVISMGTVNPSIAVATAINSGATVGSASIVVASASNMAVGKLLIINELNDPAFVTSTGNEGLCNFCDDIGWNGTRMRMQIVKITGVSGSTVTFSPALYSAFTSTPLATPYSASITNAGIENLQIFANNTGYADNIDIISCYSCWVRGVEGNYADGDHSQVQWSSHVEIRDSYFSNAFRHASGTQDSDVGLIYATSDSKIENNIFDRLHISILLERGVTGNVVTYNYSQGNFDRNGGVPTNAVYASLSMHGAHPQFNLMEGNVDDQIYPDSVWGSSSDNTVFRSWAIGTARMCQPVTGRGTVNCAGSNGFWAFQASRAIQLATLNTRWNFVGNVLGSSQQSALLQNGNGSAMPLTASVLWNTNREYDTRAYGWSFGYSNLSDGGTVGTGCTSPCLDTTSPATTALQHGNYNNIDGSLVWSGSLTHTLPASFVYSSKPSWWIASVPYPAIGPDVTSGTGPGGHVASVTAAIPAQACFTSMGGTDGGAGSPYVFNADTCYGVAAPVAPDDTLSGPNPGWSECDLGNVPPCNPGGVNAPAATAVTINNASPSLDGASMQFSLTSPAGGNSNALWVYKYAANDAANIFATDFWVYPAANCSQVQQFEFDTWQSSVTDNIEYMYGMQCNRTDGKWDIWNQLSGQWVASAVPCQLTCASWSHIQQTFHRVIGDTNKCSGKPCMYYDTLTVNGQKYDIYLAKPAGTKPASWGSNVGIQWQLNIPGANTTSTENLDSVLFSATTGTPTQAIYRPTVFVDSGVNPVVNPAFAYDGNIATFATGTATDPAGTAQPFTITYSGFPDVNGIPANATLYLYNDSYNNGCTLGGEQAEYSLNSGTSWNQLWVGPTHGAQNAPVIDSVLLPPGQQFSQVQVRFGFQSGGTPTGCSLTTQMDEVWIQTVDAKSQFSGTMSGTIN